MSHRAHRATIVVPAAKVAEANTLAPAIDHGDGAANNFGRAWMSTPAGEKTHSWIDSRFADADRVVVEQLAAGYPWGRVWWGEDSLQQALAALNATVWAPE